MAPGTPEGAIILELEGAKVAFRERRRNRRKEKRENWVLGKKGNLPRGKRVKKIVVIFSSLIFFFFVLFIWPLKVCKFSFSFL